MKKRINTIDGKILVQGGTDNELKSNEIRVNADKTLTERVDGKIVSAGGSGSGGAKIVPLIDQCRVTAVDYSGDPNADGNTTLPDENGVFTTPAIETGVIRVFTPYLYVPAVADLITSYRSTVISWNKDKQCFDIQIRYLPETFTLSIIE